MRVLVTGAAGFIGARLRRALAVAGHEVVGVDVLFEAVHGSNAEVPEGVSRVDVRDADALEPLLRGIDTVCHLAAVKSAPESAVFAAHNDLGTAVLLDVMGRAKVRHLVLASSVAVYGEGRYRGMNSGPFFPGLRRRADLDRGMFDHLALRTGELLAWEPVTEDAPLRPRGFYGASKMAQENYALAWGLATGAAVTALRYHNGYGEGARSGFIGQFLDALDLGQPPLVGEDGGQVRDVVHVDDMVAATVAAVDRRLPGFVPLNIASGHPITMWEVASIMARARGGPGPTVTGRYRLGDVRHIVADPERARRALGFTAQITPAQGLAELAATAVETTTPRPESAPLHVRVAPKTAANAPGPQRREPHPAAPIAKAANPRPKAPEPNVKTVAPTPKSATPEVASPNVNVVAPTSESAAPRAETATPQPSESALPGGTPASKPEAAAP